MLGLFAYDSSAAGASSPIATTRSERRTQLYIAMSQIQHRLWQARGLNDAPHFDRALRLDKFAHRAQKTG